MIKIPVAELPVLKAEAMTQAEVNMERLNNTVDFDMLTQAFNRTLHLKVPKLAKMKSFLAVADKLSKAVRPFTACKGGCSYCCHIAATVTETEAHIIGKVVGRKPVKLSGGVNSEETREKWHGTPCTFLKGGRCSIYEVRPLACRLHVSLADTPFFCNTAVPIGDSLVPQLNLEQVVMGHAAIAFGDAWGDIRDFFPPR